jgi:hypothetical protein
LVDFAKRARGTDDLDPDEDVLGASNVTPSPFGVANAGMTGGLIAGGVVGLTMGAAWDAKRRRTDDAEYAAKMLPAIAARLPFDPPVSTNGALLAVTTQRVVVWRISGLGKPKEILHSIPLTEIDEVWWEDADAKWLAGKPGSLLLWVGKGDRVLPVAGIAMGPAAKFIRSVVTALEELLPGKVHRFEG